MIAKALVAFARGRQRDVWKDASDLLGKQRIQPMISGLEHLPEKGPFLIIANHYERKDAVWVGWGAITLLNTIGNTHTRDAVPMMHWVMTDTWADCYVGPFHVDPQYLGWVLKGFARLYGIIRMPAHDLPNHKEQRQRSAMALREIFDAFDRGEVVALHPEAGGFETLIQPPRGAGRVLACIERKNVAIVPVGVSEEHGRLRIRIGEVMPARSFAGKSDREAADTAMLTLCGLIPEETRGVYAERYAELQGIPQATPMELVSA